MLVRTEEERKILREGGKRLANIITGAAERVAVGVSTDELENYVRDAIETQGDTPAFLGYTPHGAQRPYPAALCASVNNEVVHGIPNEDPHIFEEGDIVTLDVGLIHEGFVTDTAITVGVGSIDPATQKLIDAAREARSRALSIIRPGIRTGDIGAVVEETAKKYGFTTPHDLGGHGVGKHVHEEPFIPNFGTPGTGVEIEEDMVLAIEPIVMEGVGDIALQRDGYTYTSQDGKRSAQFEHTIIVAKNGAEILTLY